MPVHDVHYDLARIRRLSTEAIGAMTDEDLSTRLVESINSAYGVHAGHRAAHAKGVLCAATFARPRMLPTNAPMTR